jgi:hypothetical protein
MVIVFTSAVCAIAFNWVAAGSSRFAFSQQSAPEVQGGIPEKAPPGRDQSEWSKQRARCLEIGQDRVRRSRISSEERKRLPPISYSYVEVQECEDMIAGLHRHQPKFDHKAACASFVIDPASNAVRPSPYPCR